MKYPISPEYMQAAGQHLTPLYEDLEEYIIQKICKQFKLADGHANATSIELIRELQRRGLSMTEIERKIRKSLKISQKELDLIFQDAIERNELYYGFIGDKFDLVGEAFQLQAARQEAEAIARQTAGSFLNLTQSLGFAVQTANGSVQFQPIAQAYQSVLDKAASRVLSGADSYDVAIRQAVKDLSDSGLQMIDYATGHHDRADVAARRAVMTGISQISSKYTEQMAEDVPTPYREISAHIGARDTGVAWQNHKSWQGKVYSLNTGDIYPSIYSVCGWGLVDGLEGANCRHMHFPFWEGISERTYTDEELRNIDPPDFTFEGVTYNAYAATQMQRRIERSLRAVKRRYLGEKSAGIDYEPSAVKYARLNDEYERFCKASGLPSQIERSFIPEFGPKEAKEAMKAAADIS